MEYQRLQSPEENRIWKPLNEISPYIQHAFVAVEDENFYTHPGFSFKRTVLAAINEVFRKLTGSYLTGSQLGASTIEQQLIKNITGEDESSGIEGYAVRSRRSSAPSRWTTVSARKRFWKRT